MNWLQASIGDVCLPITQSNPAQSGRKTFRYVDISGVDRTTKSILSAEEVQYYDAPSRARKIIKTFDVLVSTVRPNLNAIALVPDRLNGEVASTGFAVLRANRDVLLPKYLFYWVQSNEFIEFLVANATGASYPAVTDSLVRRATIPLAPLSEQSRVVKLLDEASSLRVMCREADSKASRILPTLFTNMFGDLLMNPMGWPVNSLNKFADIAIRSNPTNCPDKIFNYIDIAGVNGERGEITETRSLFGRDAPSRARQLINSRDTLVSTVRPYLRATALVPSVLDNSIASSGFCVLKPRQVHGYAWLFQLTRQQWFTEQLNLRARGASYPAVTDADIFELPVPMPNDLLKLEYFDKKFEVVSDLLVNARIASQKIAYIFELILQQAFNGKLTEKWRESHLNELLDEMADQARYLNIPFQKDFEVLS